ncbi:MAG TPA: helix-turn-helix domain-containing protein [Actinophytocola sp.]|uniref:helix-turn-helix domain-containing protein n=1 Tax=Actinophytocola sp. TaxID=1872138 RepID=UPI002DDD940C|nr:helix-turn-helix domain-containing protein [Actinophytocola sp.]HEV2783843.1 helix-turn-helix domain-containing protein [Actinophytocola sp.]
MPGKPRKTITDAKELRALAHPLRMRLLQLISQDGPLTATQCARAVGESVANCSYHINTLAKYGYVEQADGGQGREKPWQAVYEGHSFSDVGVDEETALAGEAMSEAFIQVAFDRTREGMRALSLEPDEWREAVGLSDCSEWLTAAETAAVREEIQEILRRHKNRRDDPSARPEGARPVYFFLSTMVDRPVERA